MPPSKKIKVLFVTSEVVPFIKTGGVADVSAALPQMLGELGHEVRILVPKYGAIDERKFKIHEVVRLKDIKINIGDKEVVFSIKSSFLPGQKVRVQIYFLDNFEYFGSRNSLYTDPLTGEDYKDNDERFILLARAAYELIMKLGWVPDIVHSNDWQGGLIPAYLKHFYNKEQIFENFKTLFTIHSLGSQGMFPKESFAKTGLPESINNEKGIEHNGRLNFVKAGLLYSDCLNTVSEGYANEIRTLEEYGEGLKNVLAKRKNDLYGIINGIDDRVWNPEKDEVIPKRYSAKTIEDKVINKQYLLEKFGLKFSQDVPVVGLISRLTDAKGMDLIAGSMDELMSLNLQVILLGTGSKKYLQLFDELGKKYPEKFACYLGFNDELAHLIEAGADLFLMASKFEPCGLNQMYSLVYGTIPIVRETGGLADTVIKFNEKTGEGNGFTFKAYEPQALIKEMKRALKVFEDKKTWTKLMKSGMKSDFSWLSSAKKYIELYKNILNND
jgi:starch synthase